MTFIFLQNFVSFAQTIVFLLGEIVQKWSIKKSESHHFL